MEKKVYEGFEFNKIFDKYIKDRGITKKFIADLLGIKYNTVKSKFNQNSFTIDEICFLDLHYVDLRFLENKKAYIKLKMEAWEEGV